MGLFDSFFGSGGAGNAGGWQASSAQTKAMDPVDRIKDIAKQLHITVTDSDIAALLAGRMSNMSTEDQVKWHKLMEERQEATKLAKIEMFKQLPASMRQYIIDSVTWTKFMNTINDLQAPKTQEEQHLEILKNKYEALHEIVTGSGFMGGPGIAGGYGGMGMGITPSMLSSMRAAHRGHGAQLFNTQGPTQYAEMTVNESIVSIKQLIDAHSEQCIADGISGDLNK